MKVNGYEFERVTDEEFAAYKAIRHRLNAEWIACALPHFYQGDLTQAEFERLVTRFEDVKLDCDDNADDLSLRWALSDILDERSRA